MARFVAYPSDARPGRGQSFGAVHTHLMDVFDSTPRLAFLSPEPGSGQELGRSRCSELLVPRPVRGDQRDARLPVPQGL